MAREPHTAETRSDGAGTLGPPAEPTDATFCDWFVAWFQRVVCREPTNDHAALAIRLALRGSRDAVLRNYAYSYVPLSEKAEYCLQYEAHFCTPAVSQTQQLVGTAEEASSSCDALADEDCGARADP